MSIWSVTNIPPKANKSVELRGFVEGDRVMVVSIEHALPAESRDWAQVCEMSIDQHHLDRPEVLRRMVADSLASVVRLARDAGYKQAQHEIRLALGMDPHIR